jgi:hypothetical protein
MLLTGRCAEWRDLTTVDSFQGYLEVFASRDKTRFTYASSLGIKRLPLSSKRGEGVINDNPSNISTTIHTLRHRKPQPRTPSTLIVIIHSLATNKLHEHAARTTKTNHRSLHTHHTIHNRLSRCTNHSNSSLTYNRQSIQTIYSIRTHKST